MGRDFHINLAYLPWPMNVLKFNRVVHALQTGDKMIARINDADVVGNLRQLLGNRPDLDFNVSQTDRNYRIRVTKK